MSATYDRKGVLSLKLRSSVQLRKLSRAEFFTRMQVTRTVEPITVDAYKEVEKEIFEQQLDDSPHGHPWHVSFHASQFPGSNPMACPRQSLYRMMDFADGGPFSRQSRTVMAAGKAIEVALVSVWDRHGILLSAGPFDELQTQFEVPEAWLTGTVDSVILPPRWNKPLPVEIKTKYHKEIEAMQLGQRGPDDSHISQIKTQLGLVRAAQEAGEAWENYDLVDHGIIYYLSRDRPSETAEFRVDYDPTFFEQGVARLKQWKAWFEEDFLPEMKPGKRTGNRGHPNGWRWSYQPCAWCDFKTTCQQDFRQDVQQLSESVGVQRTQRVRPNYDPIEARSRVFERWYDSDGDDKIQDDPESQRASSGTEDSE